VFVGLVFGVNFLSVGVDCFDHESWGTTLSFRALILPGSVAFWPVLAVKCVSRTRERA
jgi:hypothetical protein